MDKQALLDRMVALYAELHATKAAAHDAGFGLAYTMPLRDAADALCRFLEQPTASL